MTKYKYKYGFDFNNGYNPKTGMPIKHKIVWIKANTIREGEQKLKVRYPNARFIGLNGRIKELK